MRIAATAVLLLGCLATSTAHAVPASPQLMELAQPDGTVFRARAWGDELRSGIETEDGYTIVLDPASRSWMYAELDASDRLVASPLRVGRHPPGGMSRAIRPRRQIDQMLERRSLASGAPPVGRIAGEHRLLVIVADFTPSKSRHVTEAEFAQYFFTGGGTYTPTSVKQYWETMSHGTLAISPARNSFGTPDDGIVFVTLPYADLDCGRDAECSRILARDAIEAADDFVDFAAFDSNRDGYLHTGELHVYIVIRGLEGSFTDPSCGAFPTWGHRTALSASSGFAVVDGVVVGDEVGGAVPGPYRGGYMQQGEWHERCGGPHPISHPATIGGAAVHEFGHDLGLPDLYDTDDSPNARGIGVGDWSVMGTGTWNFGDRHTCTEEACPHGVLPAWLDAYSRSLLGWADPLAIPGTTRGLTLPPAETAGNADRGIRIVPAGDYTHWRPAATECTAGTGEYFLLENRQPIGYDAGLPGFGLLIWHVFEGVASCRPNDDPATSPPGAPRLLALEQADGHFQLECYSDAERPCNDGDETDPWSPGRIFDDTSTPSSRRYADDEPTGVTIIPTGTTDGDVTLDVALPPVCGDGALDAEETCDDGNTTANDGCSPTCQVETCWQCPTVGAACIPDDTASCSDGNACTTADTCVGGRCVGGPALICNDDTACTTDACEPSTGCVFTADHAQCGLCEACVPGAGGFGCMVAPRTECLEPRRNTSKLRLKAGRHTKHLKWNWGRPKSHIAQGAFDASDFALCIFDPDGTLVLRADAPGDDTCGERSCWSRRTKNTLRYHDREGAPDGLVSMRLRTGWGRRAGIVVKGKGDHLPDLPLPLAMPAQAQLHASNGRCWASRFATTRSTRNDATAFVGTGPPRH